MLINPRYIHNIEKPLYKYYVNHWYWYHASSLNLSEDVTLKYGHKLNWQFFIRNNKLTEKIVQKYSKRIEWDNIYPQNCTIEFCERNKRKLNFNHIDRGLDFKNNNIEKHFIHFNKKFSKVGWVKISRGKNIPISFIEMFKNKINWTELDYSNFSDKELLKYKNKVNWIKLCKERKFKKSFIGGLGKEISLAIRRYT